MDNLLNPDAGLVITTIVTFGLLLFVLYKAAWKPILDGINQREGKIRHDLERAEKYQKEAEELRVKYEAQLTEAQRNIQTMVAQARQDSDRARTELLTQAKQEAEKLLEKGRRDLMGETETLRGQLRAEVANLSLLVAEKVLNKAMDPRTHEDVIKDSLKNLNGASK